MTTQIEEVSRMQKMKMKAYREWQLCDHMLVAIEQECKLTNDLQTREELAEEHHKFTKQYVELHQVWSRA